MSEFTVTPLGQSPDDVWIAAGPDDTPTEKTTKALLGRFQLDPRAHLVALRDQAPVGRLLGRFINPELYIVRMCEAREEAEAEAVAAACATYLMDAFREAGIEILLWANPEAETIFKALTETGFVVDRKKAYVERTVKGFTSPHEDPFTYRSLAELGTDAFVRVMTEAALGDPFEDVTERDPHADFQQLVDYAGKKFDPEWWQVAYLDDEPAGVVLPQRYPDSDTGGSLFYVGVLPAHRGKGYGKVLHAAGLAHLAAGGLDTYVGSTDMRNDPMLKIFQANGCRQTQTQLFLRAT